MTQKMMRVCHTLIGCLMLIGQSTWAQEAKESIRLRIKVEAMAQTNLNEQGRPSPIKVRVYELKEISSFEDADYFSLNTNDKTVLTADMLGKDEFILRPGESRIIEKKSHPKTTAVGILAGYQDLTLVWRVVQSLPEAPESAWYRSMLPSKKVELSVQLQPQGIAVIPKP
jgi:type VI secretion system protein VasD